MRWTNVIIILALSNIVFQSCSNKALKNDENLTNTILSMQMHPSSRFKLNYINSSPQNFIDFTNHSKKDSLIFRNLKIERPTVLFYIYDSTDKKNSHEFVINEILVFPGDSIKLNYQGKIIHSNHIDKFLNTIIYIPHYASLIIEPNRIDNPFKKGFQNLIDSTTYIYENNESRITNSGYSEKDKEVLRIINLQEKYYQLYVLSDFKELDKRDFRIMDSINKELIKRDTIFSINSPNNYGIFLNLVKAASIIKGAQTSKFWDFYFKTEKTIKHLSFYEYYAYFLLYTSFYFDFDGKVNTENTPSLQYTKNYLSRIKRRSPLQDSLFKLTNILLLTKSDFQKAKRELKNFDNGRHTFLFDDEALANHQQKSIEKTATVKLFDFNGQEENFNHVIMDKNYKLVVVDFWASWCIPCLNEIPRFAEIKEKYKRYPIKFVSICIDKKADKIKWINAAKKYGIFNDNYQYRLKDYSNSELTTLLQIKTIPRYIVFDNTGTVVDEDLERPTSGKFAEKILGYLNQIKH